MIKSVRLSLLLLLLSTLVATVQTQTQPIIRNINWKLHNASGRVFDLDNPTSPFSIGTWKEMAVKPTRLNPGRWKLIEVLVGDVHFEMLVATPPPSREGAMLEPSYCIVQALPDSLWDSLTGKALVERVGGGTGDYVVGMKIVLQEPSGRIQIKRNKTMRKVAKL